MHSVPRKNDRGEVVYTFRYRVWAEITEQEYIKIKSSVKKTKLKKVNHKFFKEDYKPKSADNFLAFFHRSLIPISKTSFS